MTDFTRSKIKSHQFKVYNNEGESGIVHDMIIGRDMMVHLVLAAYFKHKVLEWNGTGVQMKEPGKFSSQIF